MYYDLWVLDYVLGKYEIIVLKFLDLFKDLYNFIDMYG